MKDVSRYIDHEKIARVGWHLFEPKLEKVNEETMTAAVLATAVEMGTVVTTVCETERKTQYCGYETLAQ